MNGLIVVALGGNALAPPRGGGGLAAERETIRAATRELAAALGAAGGGRRVLVVHGNGTQVGRLLAAAGLGDPAQLDVHVAQTQGELGYLIAAGLEEAGLAPAVALITRCRVDPDDPAFATPTKPIGPVLDARPEGPAVAVVDGGWRRTVASPRPLAAVEVDAIRAALDGHHVVAGGGGGVPVDAAGGRPLSAVIDKDWVAALLAVELDAHALWFVTDVDAVATGYGGPRARARRTLALAEARELLAGGEFAPGSMGPKVSAAADYVAATRRPAVIARLGRVADALRGAAGTTLTPDGAA